MAAPISSGSTSSSIQRNLRIVATFHFVDNINFIFVVTQLCVTVSIITLPKVIPVFHVFNVAQLGDVVRARVHVEFDDLDPRVHDVVVVVRVIVAQWPCKSSL